ncbi:ABC transporter permease [Cryptosporangium aurantiacum]|uniref:Peptide/nickel transport system permease protein n=1 Tax=Cryptosporangium aurantiacum TaxID=134849 RepID=A0A1M7KAT8_9ACTN|nr:ABC transporter permease [Cryptosporangium aurantiacum]SHM62291.1 peptide/nickel transport system permease protein [Cryptosporangium aurantiacum]
MGHLLLRRLAAIPVTLLVISALVFLATEVLPGDVARQVLGREASDATVAQLRDELGLDRPLLIRYLDWLGSFLTGDWGTSYTLKVPVRDLVFERLGSSLMLAVFAFVLLVPVALLIGVLAGLHHDRPLDRFLSVTSLTLGATPEFVTGVVLLVVFSVSLRWFPVSAQADPGASFVVQLEHLVLPAVSLVLLCLGYVARHVRASTVTSVRSPYVRAAELRGASRRSVVTRHVLRNSTVPATSALGVQAQFLLGGLVSVELLFNYPGLGALLLTAALDKDLPTLQAAAMVLGLLYLLITLTVDVVYRLLDPRLRLGATV